MRSISVGHLSFDGEDSDYIVESDKELLDTINGTSATFLGDDFEPFAIVWAEQDSTTYPGVINIFKSSDTENHSEERILELFTMMTGNDMHAEI